MTLLSRLIMGLALLGMGVCGIGSGGDHDASCRTPCLPALRVGERLRTADATEADALSADLLEDVRRGCLYEMHEILALMSAFESIMFDQEVPGFSRFGDALGHALERRGRYEDAAATFHRSFVIRRGMRRKVYHSNDTVTLARLHHDLEQFEYLRRIGAELPPGIVPAFEEVTASLGKFFEDRGGAMRDHLGQPLPLGQVGFAAIHRFYNRAFHLPDPPNVDSYLNPTLDYAWIDEAFASSQDGLVVVDNLLRPEALRRLHGWMLRTTAFFSSKYMNLKARFAEELHMRVAYQIGHELRRHLPRMLGAHALQKAWSYKMSNELEQGLGVHADEGFINCNVWLTPTESNLDPSSGGLIIYRQSDEGDARYNSWQNDVADDPVKLRRLQQVEFDNVTIPYRSNRAICFRSSLYHRTDRVRFRKGYVHRRLGVTFLFGTHP